MMSPFDRKNKLASCLDHLALRALLFALCVSAAAILFRRLEFLLPLLAAMSVLVLCTCRKRLVAWRKRFVQVLELFQQP